MYNNNDSNNIIPLELYFSELEQFSVLKKLFFYSKKKPKKYELKKLSIIEKLLFLSKDRFKKNELIILKHFIENRNTTLYDIKNSQKLKKDKIENLYGYKNDLVKKKLLNEKIDKRNKINELSNLGIFYLLLTEQTFNTQIQKQLLINYDDFVIFKLFVYPYISYDSIKEIDDSGIFSNIFVYLKTCCERVKDTLDYIEHTSNSYNGYLTQQIFLWNKTPIENINYKSLRFFLKYYLKLEWVDKAEIKKEYQDNNILRIIYQSNTAIIKLLGDKSKAILTIKGKTIYEFIVKEIKNTNDYDYSIESFVYNDNSRTSCVTVRESHLKILLIATQQEVQILIFSILLSYGADMKHPIYDILKKDKIFMQSLKKTNHYFNQRYNDITK